MHEKYYKLQCAQIAQSVEQRTENPRVTGSIPVLGIQFSLKMSTGHFLNAKLRTRLVRFRFWVFSFKNTMGPNVFERAGVVQW